MNPRPVVIVTGTSVAAASDPIGAFRLASTNPRKIEAATTIPRSQALARIEHKAEPWVEGEDTFGRYATVTIPDTQVAFRMRLIEPGIFQMSSPDDDKEAIPREKPQHTVTLTQGYWLADAPCTQAVHEAVTGQNPSLTGCRMPLRMVSWDDAQSVLPTLNKRPPQPSFHAADRSRMGVACRAGTTTPR